MLSTLSSHFLLLEFLNIFSINYKYCSTDSFWVAVLICYSGEGEGADLWIRIPEILSLAGFWWLVYEALLPTYQPRHKPGKS